ncbi:MAG: LysR family transcriptional regulator [Cyanobacteria bacterium P01_A01_bin.135]
MNIAACQLKVSQLKAFWAVAQCGNFSAAAAELNVTQSTISHAIASLEAELGVLLLSRGRHGAVLTPIGEELLPEVSQALERLCQIQRTAALARELHRGQVRVGCVRSVATHLLPDIMAQFQQAFPDIQLILLEADGYGEIERGLREGNLDVGFLCLPLGMEFDAWTTHQDEFVALLPAAAAQSDTPLTWEQLLQHPLIMTPLTGRHHTKLVREHLAEWGHTLTISSEVREDSTVLGMVKRGLGATIMPRMAAEPIPRGVVMQSLPVPLYRTTGVATLSNALLPRAAFAFLDTVRSVLEDGAQEPS